MHDNQTNVVPLTVLNQPPFAPLHAQLCDTRENVSKRESAGTAAHVPKDGINRITSEFENSDLCQKEPAEPAGLQN
ncbi:MAG: hypothetical protein ACI856_002700 [Kiritimatiellia bacterium]|jgi:hypothetical protein